MKVLITGATGFIGKALIKYLIQKDYVVFALVRGESNDLESEYPGVRIVRGDLSTISASDIDFYEIEQIIHLAWENVSKVMLDTHMNHLTLQKEFIHKMLQSRISKFIISGSCFEYGKIEGNLAVSANALPNTQYGIAKLDLLNWLIKYWSVHSNVSFSWMRIFYVYGENQHNRSLYSQLLDSIHQKKDEFDMSRGHQIRDFIKLSDVVLDFYNESIREDKGFSVINVCSGRPVSVREFVENILKENNTSMKLNLGKFPIPEYEPLAFWGNKDFILNYRKNP